MERESESTVIKLGTVLFFYTYGVWFPDDVDSLPVLLFPLEALAPLPFVSGEEVPEAFAAGIVKVTSLDLLDVFFVGSEGTATTQIL